MESPKPPPLKKRIDAVTDERIGEAIKANQGLIYLAAQSLGYDGSHFASRVRESEYLQAIVIEAKELRIDAAERSLHQLVAQKKPDLGAICFTLKTVGKKRGYVESVEHTIDPESIAASNAIKEQIAKAREALASKLEKI